MLKNKKLFLIAILASVLGTLEAQTASPYSRYGYGVLRDQVTGPSKGMGGIGYGLRNSLSANPMNPASYSRVDSLTFLFDIGVSAYSTKVSDGTNSRSDYNGGLDYLTMMMPLSKKMGLSFGLLPFSSVGYSFVNQGTNSTQSSSGSGGLSQAYAGLGYKMPVKGLSLGANVSYIFGTTTHILGISGLSGAGYGTNVESELHLSQFKFDLGAQYEVRVDKDNLLVLGATFTPGLNSKGNFQKIERGVSKYDTITSKVNAGLPTSIGMGFTIQHKEKFTLGMDVTYQGWSKVKFASEMEDGLTDANRFNDRWKFNVGGDYNINPYSRKFYEKVKIRGGVNYSNSYLNATNSAGSITGFKEYGATLGFGFPIRDRESYGNRTSYINVNFEYRNIKPNASNMVDEQYIGISVNANINELWFVKRKIF